MSTKYRKEEPTLAIPTKASMRQLNPTTTSTKKPFLEEIATTKQPAKAPPKSSLTSKNEDEDTAPESPVDEGSKSKTNMKHFFGQSLEGVPKNFYKSMREEKKQRMIAEIIENEGTYDEKRIKEIEKEIDDYIVDDYEEDFENEQDEEESDEEEEQEEEENLDEEEEESDEEREEREEEDLIYDYPNDLLQNKKNPDKGLTKAFTDRPKPSKHFSIDEDGRNPDETESLPKLHRSHTHGEASPNEKVGISTITPTATPTPNSKPEIMELHFEVPPKHTSDLEFERILQKDEEIPYDEFSFYKAYKPKSKTKKESIANLFKKEVRYMYFKDGMLYITKKKNAKTAIVRNVIILSRVKMIEFDEQKQSVYFWVDSEDPSQNKVIEKEYKCEYLDDFLDRIEEELEPLNASVKLIENE